MKSELIYPGVLSDEKLQKLNEYAKMLFEVNKQFNLISRGDIQHVQMHHISHCLAMIEKSVPRETHLVDWGSGGGLPAIPLAIVWPDVQILAVDSVGKKTRAIDLFCRRLGISNCKSWHGRAQEATGSFQYSLSRATAPLKDLWSWHLSVYSPGRNLKPSQPSQPSQEIPSSSVWNEGLICLKGGDLKKEISDLQNQYPNTRVELRPLTSLKHIPFFDTKYCVEVYTVAD